MTPKLARPDAVPLYQVFRWRTTPDDLKRWADRANGTDRVPSWLDHLTHVQTQRRMQGGRHG